MMHSYYGGALTMFFSSAPNVPFRNIENGLKQYPTWKIQIINGDENYVFSQVRASKVFRKQWERMQERRSEFVVPNFDAAFEKLQQAGHFLFSGKSGFTGYVTENPEKVAGMMLTMVDTGTTYPSNIPLTKHSPYTILFDRGINQLKQNGALDIILKRWTSKMQRSNDNPTQVLSLFDTFPAVICMFSFLGITFILLLAEILWYHYSSVFFISRHKY